MILLSSFIRIYISFIPHRFCAIRAFNCIFIAGLVGKSVIGQYINNYVDRNRADLKKKYADFNKFVKDYTVTDKMIREIVAEGVKAGLID